MVKILNAEQTKQIRSLKEELRKVLPEGWMYERPDVNLVVFFELGDENDRSFATDDNGKLLYNHSLICNSVARRAGKIVAKILEVVKQ